MKTHLLKTINDAKTLCGIDAIKVAENYPQERLVLIEKFASCKECLQKIKEKQR